MSGTGRAPVSHANWFVSEGWMSSDDDMMMVSDPRGDVSFYLS